MCAEHVCKNIKKKSSLVFIMSNDSCLEHVSHALKKKVSCGHTCPLDACVWRNLSALTEICLFSDIF